MEAMYKVDINMRNDINMVICPVVPMQQHIYTKEIKLIEHICRNNRFSHMLDGHDQSD